MRIYTIFFYTELIIDIKFSVVKELSKDAVVDFKNPQIVIVVEIIRYALHSAGLPY